MLFKTKSQTLAFLQKKLPNKVGIIPKLYYFKVSDYRKNKNYYLKQIKLKFNSNIIIRSSSIFEDSSTKSLAGSFESILNINPKESEDVKLAEEVLSIIPEFMQSPNVLGIGEIGLNKNSKNEILVLEKHIDLAASNDQLILVHIRTSSCCIIIDLCLVKL